MKKIFVLLLIAVIGVVFALPQNVEAADEAPIEIRTVSDLMAIENNPSGSYILMNDIDLSETKKGGELDTGHGWTPIPEFSGNFQFSAVHCRADTDKCPDKPSPAGSSPHPPFRGSSVRRWTRSRTIRDPSDDL